MSKLTGHSKNDEIRTPAYIYDWLNRRFQFDVDAAASHANAKTDRYSTKYGTYDTILPITRGVYECCKCGVRSVELSTPELLSSSAPMPPSATGSIVTVGLASESSRGTSSEPGGLTPSSASDYSPRSDDSPSLLADGSTNEGPPSWKTTSGDTPSISGPTPSGSNASQHGTAAAPIASHLEPLNTTTLSHALPPTAPAPCPTTSSPPANGVPEAREASDWPNGPSLQRPPECSHIWKVNADDGLTGEWTGRRTFLNCPYSRPLLGQFIEKAISERDNAECIVMLVKVDTSTAWWRLLAAHAHIEYLRRVRYDDENGNPLPAATFASAVAILRPSEPRR